MWSNCCGAQPFWETDLCSACYEHAEFTNEDEDYKQFVSWAGL